jgi:hypothetical protein
MHYPRSIFCARCCLLVVAIPMLAACTLSISSSDQAPKTDPASLASQAVKAFYQDLADNNYSAAAGLYAGSYDWLQGNNPDIAPSNRPALLERYCTRNGGVCLPVREIKNIEGSSIDLTVEVTLSNKDGSLYERGPCCGEVDTGQRESVFKVQTQSFNGTFMVLDLPPYVP